MEPLGYLAIITEYGWDWFEELCRLAEKDNTLLRNSSDHTKPESINRPFTATAGSHSGGGQNTDAQSTDYPYGLLP